jgi:hypothetical protein
MKLNIINPVNFKEWDDLVFGLKDSSIFYTSNWAKVLQDTYHYQANYLSTIIDNELRFMLPIMDINSRITGRRGISLPFTDYCEPAILDENDFKNMLDQIIEFGKNLNWKYLEFRGGGKLFHNSICSLKYFQHTLKLTDENNLFNKLKNNTQRNIKKARKQDVRVEINCSSQAMDEFYKLNCITRKKHGLPPQPLKFFNNVFKYLIKNNLGIIATAIHKNKIIAAAIYFHFKERVIYKYGASDISNLKLRANNLVMWESIKYYAQKGFKIFDFGKTDINNDGLRRYKLSWGTDETIIKYFLYNYNSQNFITSENKESGWYNWFFKKMPMPLLKASGALLYKHVG